MAVSLSSTPVLLGHGARRHLTQGQRGFATLSMEKLYATEAKEQQAHGTTAPGRHKETLGADLHQASKKKRAPRAADKAAKVTGASGRAVAQAKRVSEKAPDLAGRRWRT